MKRFGLVLGFLGLAGLIGFVVQLPSGGGAGGGGAPSPAAANGLAGHRAAEAPSAGPVATVPGSFSSDQGVTYSSGGTGVAAGSTGGGGSAAAPTRPAAGIAVPSVSGSSLGGDEIVGPRIIETARLSLVTKRDAFNDAFERANQIAQTYHGFVQSSSTEGVQSKFGRLTIRVPSAYFQTALRQLRSLGRVEGQSISGEDVTAQYVDLQARLRNWRAQAEALLRLMGRATTVGDTLRIQNELSQVQMRVEELKGQLRVLNNQTSLATIDVSMREAGVRPHIEQKHEKRGGIVGAWRDARHGFVAVISAVIVGLGYLVPITALFALIWLGVRRFRPGVPA